MTDFFRALFNCFHRPKPEEELKFAARQLYQMVKYNKIIQDTPRYALPKYKLGYMVPINTPQEENVANNLYDKDLDILRELKDLSDNELQRRLQISFLKTLSEDFNTQNTPKSLNKEEGVPVKKKESMVKSVREIKDKDAYDSPVQLSEILITSHKLVISEIARKEQTEEKDEKEEIEEEQEEREQQDERQIDSTNLEVNETKQREPYTSENTSESLKSSESSNTKQDNPQEDKTIEDTSQNHGQTETPPPEDTEIKINITESLNTKEEDKTMEEMKYERNVETPDPKPMISEEDEPKNDYTVEDKTTGDQENTQFEFILLFKKNTSNKTDSSNQELSNNKLTENFRNESSVQLNSTETDEHSNMIQNIAERESEENILRILSTDLLDSTKYSNRKFNEDIEYLRKKRLASGQLCSHKSLNFEETLYLSSLSGETMARELRDMDRRLDAGEIPKEEFISQTNSATSTIESEDSESKSEDSESKSEDSESKSDDSNRNSKLDLREILKQAQALIPKSEVFIDFAKANKNILKRPDDYGLHSDDSISVPEIVIDAYKIETSNIEQPSNIKDIPGKSEDSGYETDPKDHPGTSAKVINDNDGEVLQDPVHVICACNIDSEKLQTLTTSEIIKLSRRNANNNRISCVSCKCGNATKSNKQSTKKTENDANEGQSSSTNNRTTNERKPRKS